MDIKIEVRNNFAATFGLFIVSRVALSDFVIAKIIIQKTIVQTARCETISSADAGSSSGQYSGKAPQRT